MISPAALVRIVALVSLASASMQPAAAVARDASPAPAAASPAPSAAAAEDPVMTALAASLAAQLAPVGKPDAVTFVERVDRPTATGYRYRIVWKTITLEEQFAFDTAGKIKGWLFKPA